MKKTYIYIPMIALLLIGAFFLIKHTFLNEKSAEKANDFSDLVESKPLPIPPLLEDMYPDQNKAEFHLTTQEGITEIWSGVDSKTLGYNAHILGQNMRVLK